VATVGDSEGSVKSINEDDDNEFFKSKKKS
jgi:hypothetical protein